VKTETDGSKLSLPTPEKLMQLESSQHKAEIITVGKSTQSCLIPPITTVDKTENVRSAVILRQTSTALKNSLYGSDVPLTNNCIANFEDTL